MITVLHRTTLSLISFLEDHTLLCIAPYIMYRATILLARRCPLGDNKQRIRPVPRPA